MENKSKKKNVWLFILYGLITVAILCIFLGANDFGAIFQTLAGADVKYILIAFALLIVYMLLSPLSTCVLARARGLNVPFGVVYSVGMTEHFFNGITPFSTGGQPFQMYEFSRAKVKVSESTGLLLMNFIIMMVVTNIFAGLSLIYYSRFIGDNQPLQIVAIVGFTMNFLVLLFMLAIATSKKINSGMYKLAAWFCKFNFIKKHFEHKLPEFKGYLDNMQSAFIDLSKNVGATLFSMLIRAVTMAVYYAITFYVLRALHVEVGYGDMFFVMCGSAFAITAVVFLPTPGSSGGIEFAFQSIFASLAGGISASVATGGMLIWRLLTYYVLMLISLFFYIGLEIYFNCKSKKTLATQIATEESKEED